jgi:beta-lactamase regulating signal transducer with metallopeptidase domain
MGFFYSFTETLLHSLWQAALLALIYYCLAVFFSKIHPLQKRNILYNLLAVQLIASGFTFCIVYFEKVTFSLLQAETFNWISQYSNVIFYCYCIVVFFRMASLFIQWQFFKQQYKSSLIKPSADIKMFAKIKAYQLGIKRKVSVWYSAHVQVPITFGCLRPIILLPLSLLNNTTVQETETIILHELAHIKSKDYLLNWLLVLMEIIYFFNPFIRILIEKLKIEREKNCDVQVINFNYDEILYAQILLKIAKNGHGVRSFQMGAVRKSSQLLNRILFFSNGHNIEFKKYSTNVAMAILAPIFLFAITFLLPAHKKNMAGSTTIIIKQNVAASQNQTALFSPSKEMQNIEYFAPVVEQSSTQEETKPENKLAQPRFNNENIYEEPAVEDAYFKQVSYNEIPLDSAKEILYNIENVDGKMTKSFKLYKVNGKWTLLHQWTIMETNTDTALQKATVEIYIDSIQ